jgi:signal peptidase II
MKRKYLFLVAISGLIIAVDQVTKIAVHTSLRLGESLTVIPHFFNLVYVRNQGAAFGFLANSHPAFREIFFLSMPPLALIFILVLLRGVEDKDIRQITALSSIFGGAIGNYIDRLYFRYVVDFLDFYITVPAVKFNFGGKEYEYFGRTYNWPAFNLADSAIVIGVLFLLIVMIQEKSKSAKAVTA